MTTEARTAGPLRATLAFVRDVAAYAGCRRGGATAALVVLGALLEGAGLVLLLPLLALVFRQGPQGPASQLADRLFDAVGAAGPIGQLAWVLAAFAGLTVVRAAVLYRRDTSLAELQSGFVEQRRLEVAERLAAAPWDQVARLRHARVVHVMSGDIQRVGLAVHFLLQVLVAAVMLAMQGIIAILLSPPLALLALALLAAGGVALVILLRRVHGMGGEVTNAQFTLLDTTGRFLGGLKLAAAQGLQSRFVAEFHATLQALRRRQLDLVRQQTRSTLAMTAAAALIAAVLVLLGVGMLQLAPPVLATLVIVFARMLGPVRQIQQGAQQLVQVLPAYATITELLREVVPAPPAEPRSGDPALPAGAIVFDRVSFAHEEGHGVHDLSLALAPGELVGIAGPSGAGKTTFADLLVGLLAPQSGAITIGGQALDATSLASWRQAVAYVAQDAWLFHGSIRHNLLWSSPEASHDEIHAALRLAGADALVDRIGLDAVVGERGTLISGGERQRLAIARAVLRRPRLLVLDEATSALDAPSEQAIVAALRALTPRPTIVMIAHRQESLALCDRLLRFADGRLATDGP